MTKTKAGERKRTVTVVIGPLTAKLIEQIDTARRLTRFCTDCNATDLAGIGLDQVLTDWAHGMEVPIPSGWRSHYT
jgi:hypothetical protein